MIKTYITAFLFLMSVSFIYMGCSQPKMPVLPLLTDSVIVHQLDSVYTSQNHLDGAEYVIVDTLYVLGKKMKMADSICIVTYHVHCTYSPAAMPEQYRREPPPLTADSTAVFFYDGGWRIAEK